MLFHRRAEYDRQAALCIKPDHEISQRASTLLTRDGAAWSNLSAPEPLSRIPLLDHAALCRRVAGEISHTHAAKTLRMMAREYESRALEGLARSRGERRRECGNVQN